MITTVPLKERAFLLLSSIGLIPIALHLFKNLPEKADN